MPFFSSFGHSDEENAAKNRFLGGKTLSVTEGEKYKGISGAKRPKFKNFSRAKRAKMKKNEAFSMSFLRQNQVFVVNRPSGAPCFLQQVCMSTSRHRAQTLRRQGFRDFSNSFPAVEGLMRL